MKHTRKNKDDRLKFKLSKAKNKRELTKSQKAFVEGLGKDEPQKAPRFPSEYYRDWRSWCFGHHFSITERQALEKEIEQNPQSLLPMVKCQRCGKRIRVVEKSEREVWRVGEFVIPWHKKRLPTLNFMHLEWEAQKQKHRERNRKWGKLDRRY